jgi:integrase/recombinase XerD
MSSLARIVSHRCSGTLGSIGGDVSTDGHLVRALADHLHHPNLRLILTAFVLAVLVVAASRAAHHDLDLDVALGGVLSPTAVWGQYRTYLLVERQCARSTISTWRLILFDFWAFAERRGRGWHRATRTDLKAFLARPCQSGRRRGEPLSAAAAAAKTVAVRQFYLTAAVEGWLPTDRMLGVRTPKVRNAAPRSLPPDVLRQLLLAARDDERLYVMVWLCYGACLRIGEVAALRVEDLYLHDGRPRLHVRHGKGDKQRWVPLHPELRAALGRMLAGRAGSGPLVGQRRHPDRPVKANTLSKELSSFIGEVAGKGSAHWLRHSGATLALTAAKGRNLEEVRELLGHASDRTTRIYVAGYDWDVASAVAGIPDPLKETR